MGFWDFLKRKPETKTVYGADADAAANAAAAFGLTSSYGKGTPRRGTEELIKAYRDVPILRTIVHKVADNIASTVWYVLNTKGQGKALKHANYDVRARVLRTTGAEPIYNDPLVLLLERGNALLDGHTVLQLAASYFLLKGESFQWIQRGPRGTPIGLWPIPPHWIKSMPMLADFRGMGQDEDGKALCYEVEFGTSQVQAKIPAEEIIFIKDPDPNNPYMRGSGVGESLSDEIDTDEYISAFIKAFFYNGATPSMVVSYDELGQEEMERAAQAWLDKHRGTDRSHLVHFTSPKPQIDTFPVDFESMGVVELKQMIRDVIRETFGVPPEIIGYIENSNRATIDAANFIFTRWVLVPLLERFRQGYQRQLVPLFDDRKVLEYVSPVPEDKEHTLAVAQSAPYALTINEWRDMAGLPPVDGGDVLVPPSAALPPIDTGEKKGTDESNENHDDTVFEKTVGHKGMPKSADEIAALVANLTTDQLLARLEDYPDYLGSFGSAVYEDLHSPAEFDGNTTLVQGHLDDFATERLPMVNTTTQDAVRKALTDGVAEGLSVEEMSKALKKLPGFSAARARTIATTEVNRSANFTTWFSHKTSGVVQKRRWITAFVNSRDSHQAMHGQEAGIDEQFHLAGGSTYYPGETGTPSEDINCGCTTVAVIDTSLFEDSADVPEARRAIPDGVKLDDAKTEKTLKEFEEDTESWLEYTENGINKGLQDQLNGLLKALKE